MTTRRSYSIEYKSEAVRATASSGNVSQTARELGLAPALLYRWRRELRDDGHRAFPGNGSPRDEELARLKRQIKRLTQERDILKKAVGIVSSPPH